jgi:hypothetical protein
MQWTPPLIALTVAYFFVNAITTYDIRNTQGKSLEQLPSDYSSLPSWIAIFAWLNRIIFAALLYINWEYALVIFTISLVLKAFPVLETIRGISAIPG